MQARYLRDSSEIRSYGGGSFTRQKQGGGLFWWSILITLLMGLATFCWFFSIMVFQHPEKPLNYKILAKFEKLPTLRKFSTYTAPQGETQSARELLAAYYAYTPKQLAFSNEILKRSYIRNYEKEEPPVYVKGEFEVVAVRPFRATDVIDSGWVVRTRSVELEDVDVEILMPGADPSEAPYTVGQRLTLDQRSTFAALVNVQRLSEDRLCASVMPLVYSGFENHEGVATAMKPPVLLNLEASWPVTQDPGVDVAVKATQVMPEIATADAR